MCTSKPPTRQVGPGSRHLHMPKPRMLANPARKFGGNPGQRAAIRAIRDGNPGRRESGTATIPASRNRAFRNSHDSPPQDCACPGSRSGLCLSRIAAPDRGVSRIAVPLAQGSRQPRRVRSRPRPVCLCDPAGLKARPHTPRSAPNVAVALVVVRLPPTRQTATTGRLNFPPRDLCRQIRDSFPSCGHVGMRD